MQNDYHRMQDTCTDENQPYVMKKKQTQIFILHLHLRSTFSDLQLCRSTFNDSNDIVIHIIVTHFVYGISYTVKKTAQ